MTTDTDPTLAALLAAVLADPADDLARLVYADRLEETAGDVPCDCDGGWRTTRVRHYDGDGYNLSGGRCHRCSGTGRVSDGKRERAEFIRVQIELAREYPGHAERPGIAEEPWHRHCGRPAGGCVGCRLLARDRELRGRQGDPGQWPTNIWEWFARGMPAQEFVVERGFVAEIRLPLAAYLERAADLFAAHPIERVWLTDKSPEEAGAGWSWFTEGFADDPATLPQELFDLLGGDFDVSMLGQRVTYPTRDAAMIALSAACVAFGRQAAGL